MPPSSMREKITVFGFVPTNAYVYFQVCILWVMYVHTCAHYFNEDGLLLYLSMKKVERVDMFILVAQTDTLRAPKEFFEVYTQLSNQLIAIKK